jgi:hypothetical protein
MLVPAGVLGKESDVGIVGKSGRADEGVRVKGVACIGEGVG